MVPAVSCMSNQRYGEITGHDTDSCSLGGTCGKKSHCAVAIRHTGKRDTRRAPGSSSFWLAGG